MSEEQRRNDEKILVQLATMDERSRNMEDKLDRVLSTNTDMAKRIATLELWKEGLMGKIAVISIVFGAGWTLLIKKFF